MAPQFVFPRTVQELEHEEDEDNPPNIASLRSSQLKEFVKGVSFDLSDKEILCLEEQQVFDNVYSLIRSFASLPSSSKSNLVETLRSNLAVLLPNVNPFSCISDEDIPITSHRNAFKIYRRPFSSSLYHENFEEAIHLLCQQKRLKEAVELLLCSRLLHPYRCLRSPSRPRTGDLCSWNTLIAGYAKLGRLQRARKLFDEMSHRDNFSWNAVMSGYVGHGRPREALELFSFHSSRIAKNHF
ncbi:hypothetical protein RJT34_11904 [Clitoria ternatea]|uniref:Pentatricopeptide repeat-containing protein n=1 Tax=Clitoria ternatea TaxID=43366 RepID=A0AAN9JNG3_CLITE